MKNQNQPVIDINKLVTPEFAQGLKDQKSSQESSEPKSIIVSRGGKTDFLPLTENMTVSEALASLNVVFGSKDVRVNGVKITDGSTVLKPDDEVSVLGQIQGAKIK